MLHIKMMQCIGYKYGWYAPCICTRGGINMNKYGTKIAACALMGTISLSGQQMTLNAKVRDAAGIPAAGVAVVLNEGSSIQDLKGETIQNIAVLENMSGLQSNIVLASERLAIDKLAGSGKASEWLQEFVDENGAIPTGLLSEEKIRETIRVANTEQVQETARHVQTEEDFQTSAGFSATETYEELETEVAQKEGILTKEKDAKTIDAEETEEETKTDEQDFSGLVIAKVNHYVNVRSIPSEEGEIVGKLYNKSVGEFVEEENGWYKITSGNCTGYVKGEYCVVGKEAEALAKEVGTTYAVVNTTTLKVRKEATTESSVLGLVPMQEELIVLEELDGWVKISIEEGDGYVSRDYVNLRTDFVHAESKAEEEQRLAKEAKAREEARAAAAARAAANNENNHKQAVQKSTDTQATIVTAQTVAASSEGSAMGKEVINYATQFVGNPYVYGGSSLTNGTDCSGFVMSVYANFGVSLPHSSSAMRSKGYDVGGLENAQPGDIVCYSGHVGLYVGNGQIVHASTSRTGIIVSSATYRPVLTVRRIF